MDAIDRINVSMTPIRFTLRQLQMFVAVARTGKISDAAVETHVTQSTMTAAIAELERVLGSRLFERSRAGVTLTHEGQLFLRHAGKVLDAAGDAARHPFAAGSALEGELRVVASFTVLSYYLLPFVARFQQIYPRVRITPVEGSRAAIEQAIESGETELAIALTSNLTGLPGASRHHLIRSRRQIWMAPSHPLAALGEVDFADIAGHTYILPEVDESEVAAMRYWEQTTLRPRAWVRTSSIEAVREMVGLGLGVTILSDLVFRPWSLDGKRIAASPLKVSFPPLEVGVIWPGSRPLSPVAEAFRDYLINSTAGATAGALGFSGV
jgi:DNA-binding transcriptional LysR family regulator